MVPGWKKVEEGRRQRHPGDSETHGSRDGASRSDADSGLVPGEKKGEGRRRENRDRGTVGQRDPNCTGHGLGLGPWVEESRRREGGRGGQTDAERPELHGPRQRPGRPGWKQRGKLGERQTDPGPTRHTRKPGRGLAVGRGLGLGPRGEGTREKEGEGRRRENWGLRDSWKPGWVPRWRTPTPGSPGWKGGGGGERDLESDRATERERERLRHRDRETERGSVPALLQVQPGAADLDLNRRQPGDATDTATPLVWNRGWGSGPRSVPTRQRTGGAVASFRHRVAPEIGARP